MNFGYLPEMAVTLLQWFPIIYTLAHEGTHILNTTCDLSSDF